MQLIGGQHNDPSIKWLYSAVLTPSSAVWSGSDTQKIVTRLACDSSVEPLQTIKAQFLLTHSDDTAWGAMWGSVSSASRGRSDRCLSAVYTQNLAQDVSSYYPVAHWDFF